MASEESPKRGSNRVGWLTVGRAILIAVAVGLACLAAFAALNSRYLWVDWRPF